jgi:hypothetical protein
VRAHDANRKAAVEEIKRRRGPPDSANCLERVEAHEANLWRQRFGFWAKQPSSKTRQRFPKYQRISLEKHETP